MLINDNKERLMGCVDLMYHDEQFVVVRFDKNNGVWEIGVGKDQTSANVVLRMTTEEIELFVKMYERL